ncbi:hypothetical protein GHT06_009983 [Daphnia sinensis]|uniref:Uncharacterized protein n=1 Tax=Daphnia sinensis TaxID=1820382 RepID=A0AAD5LRB1_9CRUS|nr:hypothetical protein GHT06_009983 [Daphnia sinensis]
MCMERSIMLASPFDGNFKLYRLHVVIALDKEMEEHMEWFDSKLPMFFFCFFSKSSETCGDSIFKAATSDAGKIKKLDDTSIMMRSCRHGIVDKAVSMHHGETFRHTHFMHLDLPQKGCTFLCGDFMCRYWDWAQKVASFFPEYKPMVDEMKPFLGRMNAKVHVWYCQILWVGHWMPGAALTLGEEQEQVFSKISARPYNLSHSSWNEQKEKGIVNQLMKRRERQLETDMVKHKFELQEFPILLGELRRAAEECKAGKKNTGDESPLSQTQNSSASLEGYNAHIKIRKSRISRIATTYGQRIKLRKAITLLSKKRSKLIAGHFPWQNSSCSRSKPNSKYLMVKAAITQFLN